MSSTSKVWSRLRAGLRSSPNGESLRTAVRICQPAPTRPEIHQIELPLPWPRSSSVSVYLIEGDPLTLVDTGLATASSRAVLEASLDALGYGLADVQRVILTHAHRDHFGLIESLREEGMELECWAHESDARHVEHYMAEVERRVNALEPLFREFGVPADFAAALHADRASRLGEDRAEAQGTKVDRRLVEGDRVSWKDWSLRVVHSPGHTPGHLLLEDEEAGILFTGDQIMSQAVPLAENFYLDEGPDLADPLGRIPRFRGLVEMRRNLQRLRGRPFKLLLPGAGGAITRADRTIRDTLLYYDVRIQRMDRGLRSLAALGQEVTAYEIWQATFPNDAALADVRTQLLLVIGALDCLEAEGAIECRRRSDHVLTHHHL